MYRRVLSAHTTSSGFVAISEDEAVVHIHLLVRTGLREGKLSRKRWTKDQCHLGVKERQLPSTLFLTKA